MRWSTRTEFHEHEGGLLQEAERQRHQGRRILDLTCSNPTRCGFDYPEELLGVLTDRSNLTYAAEPFGPVHTREAIADGYYRPKSIAVMASRMMLTASTSEAYGHLFRLLCNPGDQVLVPRPSYPLFDLLAQLHDVELLHYPLQMHDGWGIDAYACERLITPRTKAIVVVHPNNPTGHFTTSADRALLYDLARRYDLALIVDEVFLDYSSQAEGDGGARSFLWNEAPSLTFVLSGFSKVAALPQMKLAWTVVDGPSEICEEALRRLEFIADTFLSVSAPIANAATAWLQEAPTIQEQLRRRTAANLLKLDEVIAKSPVLGRLAVEGGWSVLLRVPALHSGEEAAMRLLGETRVLVHPGAFYGLPTSGFLILSLLTEEAMFVEGVTRIATAVDHWCNVEPQPATPYVLS